jgi:hypothetical protein
LHKFLRLFFVTKLLSGICILFMQELFEFLLASGSAK